MLDFFAQYGAQIASMLVSVAGISTAVYGLIKTLKTGKKVDVNNKTIDEKIQITREGIVEAFKTAKIPTEWKISISNQVDQKLNSFRDEFINTYKQSEAFRDAINIMILKILSNTAASNKLTEEEKAKIDELIKQISDEDSTIDITK